MAEILGVDLNAAIAVCIYRSTITGLQERAAKTRDAERGQEVGRGMPAVRLVQWCDRRVLAGSHTRPLRHSWRETTQPRSAWTWEVELRPYVEKF